MLLPFVLVVAAVLGSSLHAVEATTVFVAPRCSFPPRSPCGDDTNDGGSADSPLATLTKARDALRAAGDGGTKKVVLADGVYELSEVLELTAEDSGTVWAAASDSTGNVTLSGGEALYPGWLKQVMSADVLSQLPTDDARKHVRKVGSAGGGPAPARAGGGRGGGRGGGGRGGGRGRARGNRQVCSNMEAKTPSSSGAASM